MRWALLVLPWLSLACNSESAKPGEGPLPIQGPKTELDRDPARGVVEYDLFVGPAQVELLPGILTDVWAYDHQLPGPLLVADVGDRVRIHVTNGLAEPTSIHWHGLRVPNAMDGVVHTDGAGGIQPDETFTYEFVVRDAGTFWYHPHIRAHVQVDAGLYGAIVVREPPESAPDVDADRLFMLDDVRVDEDGILDRRVSGHDVMMGKAGNLLVVNGESEPIALELGAGRTERWRLVNTANARTFELELEGLSAVQIGADGGLWPQSELKPVDRLVLPVGARAELQVRLPAGVETASLSALVYVSNGNGGAVLAPSPLVTVTHVAAQDATSVRRGHFASPMIAPIDTSSAATHRIVLSATNDGELKFTINGKSYPSYETWQVPANVPAIIEIVDDLGLEHPFHLHGQFFQVLDRNGRPAALPGWRDVVLVEPEDTVRVATNFDNPGMWMYHCHILEHEDWGMMAMVEVVDDGTASAHGH